MAAHLYNFLGLPPRPCDAVVGVTPLRAAFAYMSTSSSYFARSHLVALTAQQMMMVRLKASQIAGHNDYL
jgi:hypothetical protein